MEDGGEYLCPTATRMWPQPLAMEALASAVVDVFVGFNYLGVVEARNRRVGTEGRDEEFFLEPWCPHL